MTGVTVNGKMLDINPAVVAVANGGGSNEKTQGFGEVLNKTAQKIAQQKYEHPEQKTVERPKDTETVSDTEYVEQPDQTQTMQDEATSEIKEMSEEKIPANEEAAEEETVDEMSVEQIADALTQIIEQIKEILGVTGEELLSSMESAGVRPLDLLDPAKMTQLVAFVAGEDSAIVLVTDEELYTALQDITEMVETQANSLLENTGLTGEELEAVIEKLQVLENEEFANQMQTGRQETQTNLSENQSQPIVEQVSAEQMPKEPEIIVEKNTLSEQSGELAENQQETSADGKIQPQKTEQDTKGDAGDSKEFGQQQNLSQSPQNNLSEAVVNAASEGIEKFTSESTENILRQIADMVKIVKGENLTEMELQLHPASLGTVHVSLTTKGGMVTAEFTTQNEAVKAAIEAQVSQLRANLEEQGVKIEAIEVSVASHQMEKNLDRNNQEQSQEQGTEQIQGMRKGSINLKALEGDELVEAMQDADDATRIAMEIMAANGSTMDLLA